MITLSFNKTETHQAKETLKKWGKSKPKIQEKILGKFDRIQPGTAGSISLDNSELVYLLKCGIYAGALKNPSKKNPVGRPKKNPLASRTKALRASGAIKEDEWIGGNDFHRVKPAVNKFLKREKHGQLRMALNPKKKKKKPVKAKKKKSLP